MMLNKEQIIAALTIASKTAEANNYMEVSHRLRAYREHIAIYMSAADKVYLHDFIYLVAKETVINVWRPRAHKPSSPVQSERENGKDPRQKNDE